MRTLVLSLALIFIALSVNGQEIAKEKRTIPAVGLKTNLLYDATSSINLGVEFRTGFQSSIDISTNWNPFTYSNNRKWRHFLLQPEFRLWTKDVFNGHFFGAHAHYAYYNVGNLPSSIFSNYMTKYRFQGWLAGAGVSYGYRWNIIQNFAVEATIGVGYAYLDYDKYECHMCGDKIGTQSKNYFGPTKAGISLIYTLNKRPKPVPMFPRPQAPRYTPVIMPQQTPIQSDLEIKLKPAIAASAKSEIEQFTEKYPFLLQASEFDPREPLPHYDYKFNNTQTIYFELNNSTLNKSLYNNKSTLDALQEAIASINESKNAKIKHIVIVGFASPDGPMETNKSLAQKRAESVRDFILSTSKVDKNLIVLNHAAANWYGLRQLVVDDNKVPYRDQVIDIIDTFPTRNSNLQQRQQAYLMKLGGGTTWEYLKDNILPLLRSCSIIRIYLEETDIDNHK